MVKQYVPDRGDLVWLEFKTQSGHEQKGLRPALVLSPKSYNQKTSLAILCPIINKEKGYPFEVKLTQNIPVTGVILSDQIKSLDWKARNAKFICKLDIDVIDEVLGKIKALIDL
jgi:mRNA interferase MazF